MVRPALSRPSQVHEPEPALPNVHRRNPAPDELRIRAEPVSSASAVSLRVVRSDRPSPLGEMDVGAADRPRTAARRSTVTSLEIDARLFDASAVQIVIR